MATNKTKAIMVRVPTEVAEWLESGDGARKNLEGLYDEYRLNLVEFRKACDAKRMDYQMVIDRMTDYINDPTKYNI